MMNNGDLLIKCTDLNNNETFPINYTGYGKNISPEFTMLKISSFASTP